MSASQTRRVLEVLRVRPVTIADFDRQPACDGGPKITRLAARIRDLRADGCEIESAMVKLGNARVAQYTLLRESLVVTGQPPNCQSGRKGGSAIGAPTHTTQKVQVKEEVTPVCGRLPVTTALFDPDTYQVAA